MSWEIEEEHVDKAEGIHRYMLIERSVTTRDGHPARALFYIVLGTGADGNSCPHCHSEVKTGLVLSDDGALMHAELGEHKPHEMVKQHIAKLNAFHARMDAYAARHKATVYKGPK